MSRQERTDIAPSDDTRREYGRGLIAQRAKVARDRRAARQQQDSQQDRPHDG